MPAPNPNIPIQDREAQLLARIEKLNKQSMDLQSEAQQILTTKFSSMSKWRKAAFLRHMPALQGMMGQGRQPSPRAMNSLMSSIKKLDRRLPGFFVDIDRVNRERSNLYFHLNRLRSTIPVAPTMPKPSNPKPSNPTSSSTMQSIDQGSVHSIYENENVTMQSIDQGEGTMHGIYEDEYGNTHQYYV